MKNVVNVVIYARYSSHNQTEQSIEGQVKICKKYAIDHNYNVVYIYIDRCESATTDKRVRFQQMIRDSKKGNFTYIIVYSLDRFSRNRTDSVIYKHKLKENGVSVLSVVEHITSDPTGVLIESLFEGLAEYYSKELGQKVKRGFDISASKGQSLGGRRPFGYNVDIDKKFIINEAEAIWVRQIFEWYSQRISITDICARLNAEKIKTTSDRRWNNSSLNSILRNRKYMGDYVYKDQCNKDLVPPIISKKLFYECLKVHKENSHANYKRKLIYHLSGKIYCGKCGAHMSGSSSKSNRTNRYYICSHKVKTHKCISDRIPKDKLEKQIVDYICTLLTRDVVKGIVKKAIKKYQTSIVDFGTIHDLREELQQVNKNLKCYINLLPSNRNIEIVMDKIDEYSSSKKLLEKKIEELEEIEVNFDVNKIVDKIMYELEYERYTDKMKKILIESFVSRVYVYSKTQAAVILYNTYLDESEEDILCNYILINGTSFDYNYLISSTNYFNDYNEIM